MKYKIEKYTVQETLILPLYSRKLCTELYPNLYRDESAVHLIERIDSRNGMHTLDYAERLGMGSQRYELVELD